LVSDTAPGLGVPVRAAPRRALSVARSVPSQGLVPLQSSGSTSLPCPAHPPPPSGSGATDHLHYDLAMNRRRGSTPGLAVTVTRNVTLTVTSIQRVSTWSCWTERTERMVI